MCLNRSYTVCMQHKYNTVIILIACQLYFYFSWICLLQHISINKIVYIDCLNHIQMKFWKARMSMEVICSICNFGLYNLCRLWAHLVYKTYLDNCIVPACFSPLVLTLILVSCTICIDYLHLWYTHLQFMLICGFQIFFCIIYQVQFVNKYV